MQLKSRDAIEDNILNKIVCNLKQDAIEIIRKDAFLRYKSIRNKDAIEKSRCN